MAKPWARYEVNFINHDKFRAIPANAICLWLEGKNYADDKHTDGLLPDYEVKHWRFFGAKSVTQLTTSCGLKPGTDQPYAPLWDVVEGFGFKMHDYLQHNDCREKVQARIDKAEDERSRKKANQSEYRDRMKAERLAAALPAALPVPLPENPVTLPVTRVERSGLLPDKQRTENREQIQNHKKELSVLASALDEGERAGRLLENYAVWFSTHRKGARLRLMASPVDFQEACSLCRTWDDHRLEKLATIILTTDDTYIASTDRGFKIFAMKASWADDRLRQWETEHEITV